MFYRNSYRINDLADLTQLIETLHNICIGRGSNFRHPTHSTSKGEFLTHRLLKKKMIIEVSNLPTSIVLDATGRLNQCKRTDFIQNYVWPSSYIMLKLKDLKRFTIN